MTERAGLWMRVSRATQNEEAQEPECMAWIDSHGYDLGPKFVVHGGSAFKGNEKFDAMWASVLHEIEISAITVLVVWKLDRLDRKLESFEMMRQVVEAGGRVEFVTQPHLNDLTTMGGRIALKVQEEIAYEESHIKSERIHARFGEMRAANALIGSPPFGYEVTGAKYAKTLTPTIEGRALIPEIFTRVTDGDSLHQIAEYLTGVSGREWWPTTVRDIVLNPVYKGMRCAQDRTVSPPKWGDVVHTCEALVKPRPWQLANDALTNRPNKRGRQKAENKSPLAGAVICPECGRGCPMYRRASWNGVWYYRCYGRAKVGRKGCGNFVPATPVESAVDEIMATQINEPVLERRLVPGEDHSAELEIVRADLHKLADADLPDAEFDRRLAELRAERDRLAALPVVPDKVDWVPTGKTYAQVWESLPVPDKGAWLKARGLIVAASRKEVTVTKDGLVYSVPLGLS